MSIHSNCRRVAAAAAGAAILSHNITAGFAFSNPSPHRPFGVATPPTPRHHPLRFHSNNNHKSKQCYPLFMSDGGAKFEKMNEDDDQVIAFMDTAGTTGIDCYVDSYATVDGIEYTIGSPCDYAVALCYFEGEDDMQLVPIELDDPLMDDIFPIAEGIIEDEFGEELVLMRTPQTLTLVGELEESEEGDEDDDDGMGNDADDSEEEVEILVSFEEDGQEYHLVRLLDPVLLVGKVGNENTRILLTPDESDIVMPKLESMFMSYQEGQE